MSDSTSPTPERPGAQISKCEEVAAVHEAAIRHLQKLEEELSTTEPPANPPKGLFEAPCIVVDFGEGS